MPEQFHQCVDADVGTGEFGSVRVPETMHQRARDGLGVRAGAFECAFDAGLQCSLGDALAVGAHEQRGARASVPGA